MATNPFRRASLVTAWVALTCIAWIIGQVAIWSMVLNPARGRSAMCGAPLAGGVAAGLLQWLVLRRAFPGDALWIPLTAIAWYAGQFAYIAANSALVSFLRIPKDPMYTLPLLQGIALMGLAGLAGGSIAGTLQWLGLTRWFRRAALWIPASAVAWSLAYMRVFTGSFIFRSADLSWLGWWIWWLLGGLIIGLITAFTLIALPLKEARTSPPPQPPPPPPGAQ